MKTIEQHNFPNKRLAKVDAGVVAPNRNGRAASLIRQFPAMPTAGSVFDENDFLELVRRERRELLLRGTAAQFKIAPESLCADRRYVPSSSASLITHLPSKPTQYTSTGELFTSVSNFIAACTGVDEEDSALLAFIAFSSYFNDCVSTSPCLLLAGSPLAAVSLLRCLSCVCRHSILSVGASTAGLARELRPTRLICQVDSRIDRQLAALQFSGFQVFGANARQLSGTTVLYVGDAALKSAFADCCLQIWMPPTTLAFGVQEEARLAGVIDKLQNQFLTYRLRNYGAVKTSQFDVPEFTGATREYARSLGRCIVDAPELQARLVELLRARDDAERTEGASMFDAVVVEALAVCCHERKPSVHVGEVASLANAILSREGEVLQLGAKQVGARMKSLGFRTTRLDASGRGIYLLNGECARVHKLGRALRVPSFQEQFTGCPYCNER